MSTPASDPQSKDSANAPSPKAQKQQSIWELIDNPWVVLALLFFVMAILGLPVLWKSRGFSVVSKLVLSVVVTLYTALLFYGLYLILLWSWNQIKVSLGL